MSYESTLEYIHSVKWQNLKPGLERTYELLNALGNPQEQLKFVHVAGTNGKGSTSAIIASCLQHAGYKVGLYTSPYINRFNERIQINGVQISDEDLEIMVNKIREKADNMHDTPTEFEIITAIGFLYFAANKCDIVVLEVGLGGTLDSTNVIKSPECSVITALGLDHTKILGNTIGEIATAKAGIIKPNCPVVSYGGVPDADKIIRQVAMENNSEFVQVDFSALNIQNYGLDYTTFDFDGFENLELPLIATYQPKNAAVAITTLKLLRKQGWNISDSAIINGIKAVKWAGRFEILRKNPIFLLDGSHNLHGMSATVDSIKSVFPNEKFIFIFSVMADKNYKAMIELLLPYAKLFLTVQANNPRAMTADALAELIAGDYKTTAMSCESISNAVQKAFELSDKTTPICALGTLYFSGDVRKAVENIKI